MTTMIDAENDGFIGRVDGTGQVHPGADKGSMKSIPDWEQNGGNSPVGRTTFIPYWFYAGTESLFESGLIGPVQLLY